MKEVSVSYKTAIPQSVLRETLTPETIIEAGGVYDIDEYTKHDETWDLTVTEDSIEMDLKFREVDDGMKYKQANETGPFDAMETTIRVRETDEDMETKLVARSEYTFGSIGAWLIDQLAARPRRNELDRCLRNLLDKSNQQWDGHHP